MGPAKRVTKVKVNGTEITATAEIDIS